MDLRAIQSALEEQRIDGWLFYDFHRRDPIGHRILGLPRTDAMATRRWYYLVPARGTPSKLVHRIESSQLDSLPGERKLFTGWQEQHRLLEEMLRGVRTVAMQYSPRNNIPSVSLVDAGTIEMIRSLGKEVVSSANLVQRFDSRWSASALQSHLEAGKAIDEIIARAFEEIGRLVRQTGQTDEYVVRQWLLERFEEHHLTTDLAPIVAVGPNSGLPHYLPSAGQSAPLRAGDFVLLDVWGKQKRAGAVYYDVTWVGYLGKRPPEKISGVFEVVKAARDRAVETVKAAVRQRQAIHGWEVDRAARDLITQHGYGDYFLHRTGHSIGENVHGNGANIDDLETRDDREIIAMTGFSIEPGIYLPEFGVRSELNMFVDEHEARVTGRVQDEIVRILVDSGN